MYVFIYVFGQKIYNQITLTLIRKQNIRINITVRLLFNLSCDRFFKARESQEKTNSTFSQYMIYLIIYSSRPFVILFTSRCRSRNDITNEWNMKMTHEYRNLIIFELVFLQKDSGQPNLALEQSSYKWNLIPENF
jgi:hypothetical protein